MAASRPLVEWHYFVEINSLSWRQPCLLGIVRRLQLLWLAWPLWLWNVDCILWSQECYWCVLYDRVIEVMHDPLLATPTTSLDPFQLFDFSSCHQVIGEVRCSYVLALCHAVWVHASIGQLSTLTLWVLLIIIIFPLIITDKLQWHQHYYHSRLSHRTAQQVYIYVHGLKRSVRTHAQRSDKDRSRSMNADSAPEWLPTHWTLIILCHWFSVVFSARFNIYIARLCLSKANSINQRV